jgi:predicted ATP-grasp superfamily ATP-dependent carboligase
VLGFNRLIVRPLGTRPFVFCGAVGPVPLPDEVAARLTATVRAIVAAFSLRGLGSLDFLLDGDAFEVLEVNPRPPASMALSGPRYFRSASRAAPSGAVAAHVRACVKDELPEPAAHLATDTVQGTEIVFAPCPVWIDEPAARRLAERANCHDLPSGAMHFATGDPICSVSAAAAAADAELVRAMLDHGREAVHQSLEIDP